MSTFQLVLLLFAGALGYHAHGRGRVATGQRAHRLRTLGATTATVPELVAMATGAAVALGRSGAFRGQVVVSGTAEAADGGLLRAPFSGTGCVWYRAETTRLFRSGSRGRTAREVVSDDRRSGAFRLVGGGSAVVVHPGPGPVDGAALAVLAFVGT